MGIAAILWYAVATGNIDNGDEMVAFRRGGCSRLSSLELVNCDITDVSLLWLQDISSLVNLDMHACKQVTDLGIQHIAKTNWARQLRRLDVEGCALLSDASLTHIGRAFVKLAQARHFRRMPLMYWKG